MSQEVSMVISIIVFSNHCHKKNRVTIYTNNTTAIGYGSRIFYYIGILTHVIIMYYTEF